MTHTTKHPKELCFTESKEANKLIAKDPTAFLIGWVLDQQITVPKAFSGPLVLKQRLGHLSPKRIAKMPLEELEKVFAEKPAIHRFPGRMAQRVHDAMQAVVDIYGGDPSTIWEEAGDAQDLAARLKAVPGIGDLKVLGITATLTRRFGLPFTGWEDQLPPYGTLGDVESVDDLRAYQERKQAYKRARRTK